MAEERYKAGGEAKGGGVIAYVIGETYIR